MSWGLTIILGQWNLNEEFEHILMWEEKKQCKTQVSCQRFVSVGFWRKLGCGLYGENAGNNVCKHMVWWSVLILCIFWCVI